MGGCLANNIDQCDKEKEDSERNAEDVAQDYRECVIFRLK